MTFVSELKPEVLWRHFDEILTIPRGSKNEGRMREYVLKCAKENGLSWKTDDLGNIVICKKAHPGFEKSETLILQAHLDMVNEKNADVVHDFESDPIRPQLDGDNLKATGTTLGADNGIGVAAMLAIADDKVSPHGPLELLFTLDEETGLTGAKELGTDLLTGNRLLNLDSEEEDVLLIGCAGGGDSTLTLGISHTKDFSSDATCLRVVLSGLRGGHSGAEIHLQRGNSIKLLTRALLDVRQEISFDLAGIGGGNLHNAIPREAFAEIVVSKADRNNFKKHLLTAAEKIRAEFAGVESDLQCACTEQDLPGQIYEKTMAERLLHLLNVLPHGVLSMSNAIPGLVETSANVAAVNEVGNDISILMSIRSSVGSAKDDLRQRIASCAALAQANIKHGNGYPEWQPNINSELLAVVKKVAEEVMGSEPRIEAIHAGLECGIISEKYPEMDMVSLGPEIRNPHSPDEYVRIDSVQTFYKTLLATLVAVAEK